MAAGGSPQAAGAPLGKPDLAVEAVGHRLQEPSVAGLSFAQVSPFAGLSCHQKAYGPGKSVVTCHPPSIYSATL